MGEQADALLERLAGSLIGTAEMLNVYLGERLGLSHEGSVGTGTVMRPSVFEGYAREAGFSGVEILPIDGGFWRFYRLS
jgi:hypothetical protein